MTSFLDDRVPVRARLLLSAGLSMRGVHLGGGNPALEVMVLDAAQKPGAAPLRKAWRDRGRNRPAPLLAVALWEGRAFLCGPAGDTSPIRETDVGQAERLCAQALAEPDRNAALRFLHDSLPGLETELPGIRNEGLLSNHELIRGAQGRADWHDAQARGRTVLGATDTDLLRRLGFAIERADAVTSLLSAGDRHRAVAVLLEAGETPDHAAPRFQNLSPASWAFDVAARRNLPWVAAVGGDRFRLYPVELGVGVGQRGRTDTWIEFRTSLMRPDQAALLWLVASAEALKADGTLLELLADSKRFAADLAVRLRERIYDRVIPGLATGIAAARGIEAPSVDDLRLTYAMALTVLFRLLFIAYAEDRDLLPYATNEVYRNRALKTKAQELDRSTARPGAGTRHWQEVTRLFEAVLRSDTELGVPAYGGGLFETDPAISRTGAAIATLALPDTMFAPVLRDLLLDETRDLGSPGAGPVDFRSLQVREFGTIYEGLLESELAVAGTDLALKTQGKDAVDLPARTDDAVMVRRGETYLHNRSGARKSSGSYFTPGFVVDHLLDVALEPALAAHAERLSALDDTEAAASFFDIRIADIAMGSGHFLVAAVDRVERALSGILAARTRPLPGVAAELATLRTAAEMELAALGQEGRPAIEDGQLLRRLIARRCIYGVDLNPLAVDLARLSIWIHSFVPGLPLSLLDHSLVHGNSLVGIATIRQIEDRFSASGTALFPVDAQNLLGDAAEPLNRLARLADATPKDIRAGRDAMEMARVAVGPTRALCDLIVGERVAPDQVTFQFENWPKERARIQANPALTRARAALAALDVFHFPVAFPEVFLRRRPGFDVILGNPPWDKVKIEEHDFWARHFPGLRGLSSQEREARMPLLRRERPDLVDSLANEVLATDRFRSVLLANSLEGLGAGDPDLYKAFAWRFWQLAAEQSGRIGVVLPRSTLATLGSEVLRRLIFNSSEEVSVSTLTNKLQWVFPEVHPQFTFALLAICRGKPQERSIALRGPYASRAGWDAGLSKRPHRFASTEVLSWTSSASLPLLPSDDSIGVFAQLRKAPRLDLKQTGTWRARPDTELHATNDKALMTFDPRDTSRLWPVMKGESFDIWQNDRGPDSYYAWADPANVTAHLQARRLRSFLSRRGTAHSEFSKPHVQDERTLPCLSPRVAFRDVSRATDIRTVRASLLPPQVFCVHQSPYILWPEGDSMDQSFLLGALCSIPLDWYARRFVENHLTYFILNPFPIPRPPRTDPHWRRAVALAGRLACPDDRFAAWAKAVGVAHGPLRPDEKQAMIEELDAVVARLYGLTPDQFTHIFDTFHGWPDATQTQAWAARRDRTLAILRGLPDGP